MDTQEAEAVSALELVRRAEAIGWYFYYEFAAVQYLSSLRPRGGKQGLDTHQWH
jgi:hypothetical protein